jgi:vacuolar-type H+-ATPase subunit E/Vma4
LPSTEVESTYEKALNEEEERITYQRKMLLLSVKKIRERENEMLIQGKNCVLRKRVEANENELETMLRNLEKQVKYFHGSFAFFPSFYFHRKCLQS